MKGFHLAIELVEAMCRFSPELLVVCAQRHMEGMPVDMDMDDEEYSLPSLELADASELYGFALKSDDGSARIDGKDLEDLFRFCKLVQGIPEKHSVNPQGGSRTWLEPRLLHDGASIYGPAISMRLSRGFCFESPVRLRNSMPLHRVLALTNCLYWWRLGCTGMKACTSKRFPIS